MRIKKDEKQCTSGISCLSRIFDIAEFSVHDGPGVRVVVYFQGCNARCDWCHSPHSQPHDAPLLYNRNRCTGCQRCATVCPNQAHRFEAGRHEIDRGVCTRCGSCIDNCPNSIAGVSGSALHLPTVSVNVINLFEQIEPYIRLTGSAGNITLSGGEALLQLDAVEELLGRCKQKGYHTAVETSGLLPISTYARVEPLVDLWLFGMRVITGKQDGRHDRHIDEVLGFLSRGTATILPRIPLVPGFFDRDEVLDGLIALLDKYDLRQVCLNPWNKSYDHYYKEGGTPLRMYPPTAEEIHNCETKIKTVLNQFNFNLYENEHIIRKSREAL